MVLIPAESRLLQRLSGGGIVNPTRIDRVLMRREVHLLLRGFTMDILRRMIELTVVILEDVKEPVGLFMLLLFAALFLTLFLFTINLALDRVIEGLFFLRN